MRYLLLHPALMTFWLLLPGPVLQARADEPSKPSAVMIKAAQQFSVIEQEWDLAQHKYHTALEQAKTKAERAEVSARLRPDVKPYADRCLRLFEEYPDTWGGAAALYWVACQMPRTKEGEQALTKLKEGPIARADLRLLWGLFGVSSLADPRAGPARGLAPLVFDRAAREPQHAKAADMLIWVCRVTAADRSAEGAALYRKAGDLLIAWYPDAMYLWRFCDVLKDDPDPAWAEGHLRTILKGKDPANRLAASFALAVLLQNKDEVAQMEAQRFYRRVIEDAPRVAADWNRAALKLPESVHLIPDADDDWVAPAKAALEEIEARGLGKPAPELAGEDLDGKPVRLAEFRGKVVLLSFWASWCRPCMALVPHERELSKRLEGRPFALLGVNGDEELAPAKKAVADKGITWRSLRNAQGEAGSISQRWKIAGWPTLYLIDQKGIIRKRWVGAPPAEVLDREVERLVMAADQGQ